MATKQELLAEAYRRGLMPPERKAAYEEALRRGLLGGAAAAPKGKPTGLLEGMGRRLESSVGNILGAFEAIPGMSALAEAQYNAAASQNPYVQGKPEAYIRPGQIREETPAMVREQRAIGASVIPYTDPDDISLGKLFTQPEKALPAIGEQALYSLPSMLPFLAGPQVGTAVTAMDLTGDVAYSRADANKTERPSGTDWAVAAPVGAASAALEKIGAAKMLGPIAGGAAARALREVPREMLRAGATEALTEAGQEALQYAGSTAGTATPFSTADMLRQAEQGALVGGGMGAGVRGVTAPIEVGVNRLANGAPAPETPPASPAPGTQTDPDAPLSSFEQAVAEIQARRNIPREDAEAMVRMAMPELEQVEDAAGTDTGGLGAGVPSPDGEPVGDRPAGEPADAGRGDVGAAGGADGAPDQRAELVEPPLKNPLPVHRRAVVEAFKSTALDYEEDYGLTFAPADIKEAATILANDPTVTPEDAVRTVIEKRVEAKAMELPETANIRWADVSPDKMPEITPPDAFEARDQEQQETPVADITPPVSAPAAEVMTPSPEPTPQLPEPPAAVAEPLSLEPAAAPKADLPPVARVNARKAVLDYAETNNLTPTPAEIKTATTALVDNPAADLSTLIAPAPAAAAPDYIVENARGTVDALRQNRPDVLKQVTDLHADDFTAGEIAQQTGLSPETVRDVRLGLGLPGQGKPSNVSSSGILDLQERAAFEAWRDNYKTAGQEPAPTPTPAPEPTIKEIPDTPYAPAWRALQAFEAARAPTEAVEQLKGQIEGYDKLKSEGKTPAMTPDMFARFITKRAGQLTTGTNPPGPEQLTAPAEDGETPSFARSTEGQERTPLPMENVTAAVKDLSRGWTNSPQFIVTPTFAELPAFIREAAGNDPAGLRGATFRKGNDVYIVADQHTTPSEVKATVFHEALGHSGLQKYFGDTLTTKLQDIYDSNPAIKTLTDTWLESNPDAYSTARNRTARAIEEVLAERSEGGTPQLPVIRRALATLKGFLRDFASRFGMKVGYSDADVQAILARAHGNIRKGAATRTPETQKAPVSGYPDSPAFARTPPAQKAAKKSQEKLTLAAKKVANAAASAGARGYDNSAPAKELIDAFSGNIKARDAEAFVDEAATQPLSGWPVPVLNAIVPQIPSADIVRWAKTEGLELDPAYRLITEMAGYHGRLQRASTRLGEDFNSWISKNGSDVMSATMHYARLAGLSFSSTGDRATALQTDPELVKLRGALANAAPEKQSAAKAQVTLREKDINKGYDLWDALGQKKGGHEMYRQVHQYYEDMYNLSRALIKQRIEGMGLKPKDEAKLWQTVRLEMEQARDKGDYFPLMRHGKYYAYYKTSPVGRIFETFDTEGERSKAIARYQKDFGIKPDGQGSNVNEVRDELASESAMLRAMLDAVRKQSAGNDTVKTDKLLDDTYQMFLQFLPERSLRKQFIHTKNGGVAGFSSDVARNFASMAGRYATQLPKLKYAHKVQAALDRADDTLKGRDPGLRERLGIFSGEVRRRAEQEFNPEEPNAALSVLNRATATFLLSGGATALAQTIAIPQRVLPHLTRYYGFGPTNRMALKYMQFWKMVGVNFGDFGRQGFGPSIGDSAYIKNNPVLKEIFDAGQDQFGLFESNASHYLDTAPSPTTPTGGLRGLARDVTRAPVSTAIDTTKRVADVTSRALMWTFSVSERLVNQQTYMMAAELELAKSGDKEKAKEAGVRAITDAIGRYQRYERPQIMRGTLGPTLTMFKMYPVHTTSFFIRNVAAVTREMLKNDLGAAARGLSKGDLKAAARELSRSDLKAVRAATQEMGYVLAMTGVFAGAVGMPLYSTIMMVTDLVIKSMDDEEEEAERLADDPFYGASADLRFRYRALPNLFGDNSVELGGRKIPLSDVVRDGLVPTLTDAGIGSRASLDGIWFRAGQGDSTPSVILNTIAANLPGASFVTNFGRGYDLINQGEVEKGLEAMLPAGVRNPMRAARLGEEGITTNRGDPILEPDEFTDANFLAQVLGLPVQRIAGRMDAGRKVKARTVQLGKERQTLLRRFNKLGRDPQATDAQLDKLSEDIHQFNATVSGIPKLIIDQDALNNSWTSFGKRPVVDGYVLDPRLGAYELEVLQDASPPE